MTLLFADTFEKYASLRHQEDDTQLSAKVSDLFDVIDNPEGLFESEDDMPQQMFVASVANEYYKKSIADIKNTKIGNKSLRGGKWG